MQTMAWTIDFLPDADAELRELRLFDQKRIVDGILEQLSQQPDQETRNRKCLGDRLTANFDFVPPLWELRIGEYRVFYGIETPTRIVVIHAVRMKPPTKTTSEVLNEDYDD